MNKRGFAALFCPGRPTSKKRSGQMIFEFIVAAMLFFAIIFYVINYMSGSVNTASAGLQSEIMESKVVQISEILVRTEGDWEDGLGSPGLVGEQGWPVLSNEKILWLGEYCTPRTPNYKILKDRLGLMEGAFGRTYELSIKISNSTEVILECGRIREELSQTSIKRFAVSEDRELLSVDVVVS